MLLALHRAALDIFEEAGGLAPLRAKSELLTGYLEFLIDGINKNKGEELFTIITPENKQGAGLPAFGSLQAKCQAATFNFFDRKRA